MTRQLTTLAKKKLVVAALEDIKGRDILAIDVRKITSMFDWIVVASADSARQTKALARHVRDKLKEAGCAIIGTEGEEGAEWVLVDSGDIVAHVMQPAVRAYYNLEELWGEGKFDRLANPTAGLEKRLVHEPLDEGVPRSRAPRTSATTGTRTRTRTATTSAKPAPRSRRKPAAATGATPKPRRRKPAA
jgi:ribosome-associated protein